MSIVHGWAYGSCRLLVSGHRISSTSQAIFSSAKHRGNFALCAESIHGLTLCWCLRRPVPLPAEEACEHEVGGHIRTISKPKIIILWGLEMVCKGASIGLVNQLRTRAARWKQTLSQTTTNLGCSGLSCTAASWSASRNVIMCSVLKGPSLVWWCSSPWRLMAAHNEIFPLLCPGTCTIALWPITVYYDPVVLFCWGWIQPHQCK